MTVGGGAVVTASRRLRERILAIAAHQLEISPSDLVMLPDLGEGDRIGVSGQPDVSIPVAKVAESAWLNWDVPESETIGLEERYSYNPEDISYSYATHAAEVSVDLDTGLISIDSYWVAHDSGVMVNPMICDGQILGGLAQGLGIALHEEMRWTDDGQPITTTYLDYVLPVSADVPNVQIEHMVTPSPFVPGGMKGLGEGGVIPTPAAIANAVANAVPEIAGGLTRTPLSPSRMWHLMDEAGLHE
jgi:carbon-monoxide dehydrogenase large subunit